MTTQTLYHATDAANVDSILTEGLRADDRGLVFATPDAAEAERVGEIYNHIDDVAVVEVEVMEHQIEADPDPHGDINSRAVRVYDKVPAYDVQVAE
jgi:RNA:NAD 2'-phosphotransferase (TPT1/KptA family)